MTISKDEGMYWVECDSCSETIGPYESWSDAKDDAGKEGWKTFKYGDEWRQNCMCCYEDWSFTQ